MQRLIFFISVTLFSTMISFSQSTTPTPPQTPENEEIVKISTTLIQIDVTVTDKEGKIVTDLKPEDFEVYENGKKQTITNFSFVSSTSNETKSIPTPKVNKGEVGIPIPPVQIRPEQVRRTIALVVDDLGLSFESIVQVKQTLKKFVDEQMQPSDLVAIISTGGGIGTLQQFTSDKNILYLAIERISWNAMGRAGVTKASSLEGLPGAESSQGNNNAINPPTSLISDAQLDQIGNQQLDELFKFREDFFSLGTMGAISFIINGMEKLPGKKAIMLFSEGFAICDSVDVLRCSRMTKEAKKVTDFANRSGITIYAQDVRGLIYTGLTAVDNVTTRNVQAIQQSLDKRASGIFNKREGLSFLANETGGRATFNNNDLNLGLDKMLDEQKSFYLIAYEPDSAIFDAQTSKFNKLEVKLNKRGYNVRNRSGFFGIDNSKAQNAPVNQTPAQQLSSAIASSFNNNGIGLRLNSLFGVDDDNVLYVNSLLFVEGKDITFTEQDGVKKALFDVLAVIFDESGNPVDQFSSSYNLDFKEEAYKKFKDGGAVYSFVFPIKKSGPYQMRVALRDANNSRIGSESHFVQIPDLSKNKLVLSAVILENLTIKQWEESQKSGVKTRETNPMQDTSLRRFKRGTILRYASEIYNSKINTNKPNISTKIRIFKDNNMVLNGKTNLFDAETQSNLKNLVFNGMLTLGEDMPLGTYTLQIIANDNLAPNKDNINAQSIQFEIIE